MKKEIIEINNVSKKYRLGMIGGTTLRDELQRRRAARKGLEDPTRQVNSKDTGRTGEEFLALHDINIAVYEGERVGIIGHNGAGKSTLLKLISQITAPTTGTIEMNGRIASMLEVGTGFHPELTGRENIFMNGAILGMTKQEIAAKIEDIIEFSECRQFIDTPVKRYSSGMFVKLAFSVAAHLDSEIMIMDEVLAVGDMAFQKKCLDKMSRVSKDQGRTILYVSHNMNTIRALCNRVVVLSHGTVIYDGDVETAIGIYLGIEDEKAPVKYDLGTCDRPSEFHGTKLRMTDFEFLGKDIARFTQNEPLKFRIGFKANATIEDLKLYYVIKSADGFIAGMTQTDQPFCNAEEGKSYSFEFAMDISNIAPGKYYFIPDIFSDDGTGRHLSYDHPSCNIVFDIVEDDDSKLRWNSNYYGHVQLNPIERIS